MPEIGDVINVVLSNPQLAIVMLIQFILGLALGYIAVKALKYIIAFIAIMALGLLLSVWTIRTTPEEVLKTIGLTISAVKSIVLLLGLTTAGPVLVGFIVGVIIALVKK